MLLLAGNRRELLDEDGPDDVVVELGGATGRRQLEVNKREALDNEPVRDEVDEAAKSDRLEKGEGREGDPVREPVLVIGRARALKRLDRQPGRNRKANEVGDGRSEVEDVKVDRDEEPAGGGEKTVSLSSDYGQAKDVRSMVYVRRGKDDESRRLGDLGPGLEVASKSVLLELLVCKGKARMGLRSALNCSAATRERGMERRTENVHLTLHAVDGGLDDRVAGHLLTGGRGLVGGGTRARLGSGVDVMGGG